MIVVPAMHTQRQIWLANQIGPASLPAYVKESFIEIIGPLERDRLTRCLERIVASQPALRANLVSVDRQLVQRIHPRRAVELTLHQASPDAWQAVTERLFDRFVEGFRFDEGALCEWHLIALGPERHILYFPVHHAVWDAHTSNQLVRALHQGYVEDDPRALADATEAYVACAAEDARYAASDALSADAAYWKQHLPAVNERPRFLRRAAPGAAAQGYAVSEVRLRLEPSVTDRLRTSYRSLRAPPFVVVLGAVAHLLREFSRARSQVLATAFAGREHADAKGTYGCFVNTVPLHVPSAPELTFEETIRIAAGVATDAHRHQRIPLDDLYRTLDPSYREAPVPVFLNFKDLNYVELEGRQIVFRELEVPKRYMDYALNINVVRAKEYEVRFEYNRQELDASLVQRLAAHFRDLTAALLSNPRTPVQELSPGEAYSLDVVRRMNDTDTAFPVEDGSLFDRFSALARRRGDSVALRDGPEVWSAARLLARAEQYAGALRRAGAGVGQRVPLLLPRSAEAIAAMLGILARGCVIVPLDPVTPVERLKSIFDACDVHVYIAAEEPSALHGRRDLQRLNADDIEPLAVGAADLGSIHHPEAYVLYTSGSSGRPKGVIGTTRGIWNRIQWQWQSMPFDADEVSCHKTGLFWVDSVSEIFAPLLQGVPLVILGDDRVKDVHALLDALEEHRVTRLVIVPSLLRLLCDAADAPSKLRALRYCHVSGEAATADLVERVCRLSGARLINLYGMTECAGDSTFCELGESRLGGDIPIGAPLANTRVYVLDEEMKACPVGIPGEVFVTGAGLCAGYVGGPLAENDPFRDIALPGLPAGRSRAYKTGDLGAVTPSGEIVYLGRKDRELKIRGMRIHPAEVEAAALLRPGIRHAVACALPGRASALHLFYQPMRGAFVTTRSLEAHLRSVLPTALVPDVCIEVTEIPRLPNGKVDLAALAATARGLHTEAPKEPARSGTEQALTAMWGRLLGIDAVPVDRTFFDLGGDSMLALEMAVALEKSHGVKLGANRLVMRTIRDLAPVLGEKAPS